ncbi:MAG: type ISP restriction/modification enzyme, partial [Pseudomonadota bacterium]
LLSMDNAAYYGDEFYRVSFDYAVEHNLLCDYKVIILAVDQNAVSSALQKRLKDENNELTLDDESKIIGCYKALTKQDIKAQVEYDKKPVKSALAFCSSIKLSKAIVRDFNHVVDEYRQNITEDLFDLDCRLQHIDGTDKANTRQTKLDWLANPDEGECHVLSNMRCLSEGVDVPSLDAILFMHPRKSQIDIVQAVGRVMRKAGEDKKMGYVIIPVGVATHDDPASMLSNHAKYKTIWQVLNALRSHDENLDNKINQGALGQDISNKISIQFVSDHLPSGLQPKNEDRMDIGTALATDERPDIEKTTIHRQEGFVFDEIHKAIMNKIVEKCGDRPFWHDWARDIANIAQNHITQLTNALDHDDGFKRDFDRFLAEIRDDLNDGITRAEAIEMLAQHLITKPVFDTIFKDYHFAELNSVSKAMDGVLQTLERYHFKPETQKLQKFYDGVKKRVEGLSDPQAKQKLIIKLYDQFFKGAFEQTTKKLGIVYTPIEVVDFIIHSVNDVLKDQFNQTLGSQDVHILDPFTGTGSFIVRLIESGLCNKEQLIQKFTRKDRFDNGFSMTEIHANEIILLAYYIASINIEQAYHQAVGGGYKAFEGICLTDSFQLHERDDMIQRALQDNSKRRMAQKSLDTIQVMIGNPPYNVGKGVDYPHNTKRISETYAKTLTTNKNSLYDSYIRAMRWASDRIGDHGVIGFVTGSGFLLKIAMDNMRKCLASEFNDLYILNLRGDIKKQMLSGGLAGEGDNIFGNKSQTGVAISILVKNKHKAQKGQIHYHDIGDYLERKQKLDILRQKQSIKNLEWQKITPNQYGDWLNQRDDSLGQYMIMGDKKDKQALQLFNLYSAGVKTNRDAWCYNASKDRLAKNMQNMINFYNDELDRYHTSNTTLKVEDFILVDAQKIKWNDTFYKNLDKNNKLAFDHSKIFTSLYRPFSKENLYYARVFNERVYQMPQIFPEDGIDNLAIGITGVGGRSGFSCLITDKIPDLGSIEASQYFPLKIYHRQVNRTPQGNLLDHAHDYSITHGISDAGFEVFKQAYPRQHITKDDIFYYIYGLLHSDQYRERFGDNLTKELPRIPCVQSYDAYAGFVKAGRALADLHLNYESLDAYQDIKINDGQNSLDDFAGDDFRVIKMKHPKHKITREGKLKSVDDQTIIIYNDKITLSHIPLKAYRYVVNGKSAVKWVMERQSVKTDKDSGIINDANDYAILTMGDPAYPLKLLLRIITLSLKTQKIIDHLPTLDI